MRTLRLRTVLTTMLVLGTVVPAAADAATWSATRTITGSADVQFRAAMGTEGTAAVTWVADGAVRAAVKRPGAPWSRDMRVSDGRYGVARPDVTVTGRGEVVVAWAQNGTLNRVGGPIVGPLTIRARARGVGGRWGTTRKVGTTGHFIGASVDLAANAAGESIVSWRGVRGLADGRNSEAVQSAFRRPSTAFGAAQTVRDPESTRLTVALPVVTLDLRGTAHAAYTAGPGPVVRLASRTRGARGAWNAPRNLGPAPAAAPVIAVARDRTATVAWRASALDSEGDGIQSGRLDIRSRRPDGSLTATQRLFDGATRAFGLAVAPDGETTATWTPSTVTEPSPELHWTSRLAGETAFGPAQVVGGVAPSSDFHVGPAALGDGTVLEAYTASDRARVVARPPGGTFAATPELDRPGLYPLVVGSGARAVAIWAVTTGDFVGADGVAFVAAARIP
jgi:hypothetical protein